MDTKNILRLVDRSSLEFCPNMVIDLYYDRPD